MSTEKSISADKIRIRMLQNVRPDFPLGAVGGVKPGTILRAGMEYDAVANQHGAVSGICENGEQLGVKPGEFEFIDAPELLRRQHDPVVENHDPLTEFGKAIKQIIKEVEAKKMVPLQYVIEVLKDYSPYCGKCDADGDAFLDCSGDEPVIRCMWCKRSISIKNLANKARALPSDYLERMFKQPAKTLGIEQIGDDIWITNGYALAEIAGDVRLSYPDRNEFKQTKCISKLLSGLNEDGYEKAQISQMLYREKYNTDSYIAVLKSQNHTVYINNDFTKHIYGIFEPFIRGPLEPVLVKVRGKLHSVVLPMRFEPSECEEE